ncbi:hypothetical protein CPJCM30710_21760 [Clostridium polyendosporum]|uniref:Spore coat associated protein JA (CotJA) n=1 Tax=Clostridium polyendosporum TaxID=69208 RepID=A0A919RZN0_9CLOT|nr:spore coat associated protein CotJA [Clostridium polyendosporum]GIM29510.1 hypothetical protein CPJCM30710_21760 [Clostridium polyendosporum]
MYYEEPNSIPRDILVQMPMDMYMPMDMPMDRSKGKAKFEQSPTGEAPIAAKCLRLAHAYVPDQPYERLFSLREALLRGTLFADLFDPYCK